VFSTDVARALVETNAIAPLKFMPNEDATFGFWVMGMNLRRVDHPRAKTAAGHCCYKCGPSETLLRTLILILPLNLNLPYAKARTYLGPLP